jgi:hypothetical protein
VGAARGTSPDPSHTTITPRSSDPTMLSSLLYFP